MKKNCPDPRICLSPCLQLCCTRKIRTDRDIYPDTWVATDALGRTMPEFSAVGPVKEDQRRVVGHLLHRLAQRLAGRA